MHVYCSLLLFPQIDCPRWLPHLSDPRRSEPQLSVTSWMYIVAWPWLQCQRKFVSTDVSCNASSFDWRNQYDNKANLRDLIAATRQVISNRIQIVNFSARVTAKFYGWPRKTIGHFFCTTSSFVHHFKSTGEFKLDLQSRNAQFGSKLVIRYPVSPWNFMDDFGKQ